MDKTIQILEAATFLQHETAKNFREQLPVFLRLWDAETVHLKISWQAAAYPVLYVGVGIWGRGWGAKVTTLSVATVCWNFCYYVELLQNKLDIKQIEKL